MTHDDAFLQAIIENPDDDSLRLIYADWLEDHGQPERAEFIRVQCQLVRMPTDDPRRPGLLGRENELLNNHKERWLEPLRQVLARPRSLLDRLWHVLFRPRPWDLPWHQQCGVFFRRGFVDSLSLSSAEFLTHAEALFRAAPLLTNLSLTIGAPEETATLFDSPHLARLCGLSLHGPEPQTTERLVSCGHLGKLKSLALCSPLLDAACIRVLADAALLEQLTDLTFFTRRYLGQSEWTRGTLGDDAVGILTRCSGCRNLVALDLGFNRISDAGAAAIAASPHLSCLKKLVLLENNISQAGKEGLKARYGDRVRF